MDFPGSDRAWINHLERNRDVKFDRTVKPTLCALVQKFQVIKKWKTCWYSSNDTFSSHIAATAAGIDGRLLPVSELVASRHPCLLALPVGRDLRTEMPLGNKLDAYRWAVEHLLPNTSMRVLFNADNYFNSVPNQGRATIMSLDYAVQHGAFIMNLSPLWQCDPLDCGNPPHRKAMPQETALFVKIVSSRDELVSLFGWVRSSSILVLISPHFFSSHLFFSLFFSSPLLLFSSHNRVIPSMPTQTSRHMLVVLCSVLSAHQI